VSKPLLILNSQQGKHSIWLQHTITDFERYLSQDIDLLTDRTSKIAKWLPQVLIVGAGPSGLVLGLLLGKKGINVEILDAAEKLDEQPRATHYNSPATHVLKRAGVLDEIRASGVLSKRVVWRKPDGTLLGALDYAAIPDERPERMVALPLNEVSKIVLRHIQCIPSVEIKWSHNVVDVGQNNGEAWVDVETATGKQRLEADYIIGCDGANSKVRRVLQGDWNSRVKHGISRLWLQM
jgi:2-polyprenyl-6-methoxyphenol hydroxylase-like FAD-dependent oxidoreductase